jgi:mutual gliding-motility protein MglA
MVFFNWATMQMAAKIVYYGPGLCGKTTNLSYIYAKTSPGSRGEMVSLETETDRTLFFDLLPIEVGKVGGFRTRLQLYTVPGQVFYNTTRKLVLKGVDGIVFVADSQRPMAEANVESFHNLDENLRELGIDVATLPVVLQYNKRDLKNILSVDELSKLLNADGKWEAHESVAVDGVGVFETLKGITKQTLKSLRRRMATQETATAPLPSPAAAARPQVSFNPAGLSAAVAEGLATENAAAGSSKKGRGRHHEAAQPAAEPPAAVPAAAPVPAIVDAAAVPDARADEPPPVEPAAVAEEYLPAAAEVADAEPAPEPAVEVAEEAAVEFATTPAAAPSPAALADEMRHVKVASSLDILAELDALRKASTSAPASQSRQRAPAPGLDLDSLLQGSLNSRHEVKRRVEEEVGDALRNAAHCVVRIHLVDGDGKELKSLPPVDVDLKPSDRLRHLALTLNVNLRGA